MTISAYYNEFDPKAAAWLRQLIKNGNITPGEVDERSITEISPDDLVGFDRVHFFAGIGTWDYCLNQSGWGDRPIWTASLPCQPFSAAGKGLGKSDERHLLPHFIELVRQCKPDTIFGEQVEGAIKHGWLDDLQTNMEAEGYAIGHCVLGAHSVGAAHIRQRLYWVADSQSERVGRASGISNSETRTFADSRGYENWESVQSIARSSIIGVADTFCFKRIKPGNGRGNESIAGAAGRTNSHSSEPESIDWIYCRDNKYRPIKSGIKPLVNGIARGMVHSGDPSEQINANETQEARVMRLKGYGNAIQAQTAMAFISAYMSILNG